MAVRLLAKTWRFSWETGKDDFFKVRDSNTPIIFCAWHNRMLGSIGFIHHFWLKPGKPIGALISRSRDGDLGAYVGQQFGGVIIRGSPNKGAMGSLRALFKLLGKDRISTVIYPDGSRGPKYRSKMGPIGLARMTGARILPWSWESDDVWIVRKSWDQYRIPKPFARIRLAVAPPISVEKSAKDEQLEIHRRELEDALNRLQIEQPED